MIRPRSGREIGFFQLVGALKEVYNLSSFLAIFLSLAAVFFCGKWWSLPWKLSLRDLAQHNHIEHDCSLTRPDAAPGAKYAPNHVNFTLLCRLLDITDADTLSFQDFVKARIRRAMEDKKPIDALHKEIAHGEAALTILALGMEPDSNTTSSESIKVPRSFVRQWFGEDRLPDGWSRPLKPIGFKQTVSLSGKIKKAIAARDWIAQSA